MKSVLSEQVFSSLSLSLFLHRFCTANKISRDFSMSILLGSAKYLPDILRRGIFRFCGLQGAHVRTYKAALRFP